MAVMLAGAVATGFTPVSHELAASGLVSGSHAQNAASAARESVTAGVFTDVQASLGQQEFQRTCTACHNVAEHTGARFETRWAGTTLDQLFDLISETMPQSDPGSLEPGQYAGIVAFFLKQSGYPSGGRELPSTSAALEAIRVEPVAK
jgi:hypothetical protein